MSWNIIKQDMPVINHFMWQKLNRETLSFPWLTFHESQIPLYSFHVTKCEMRYQAKMRKYALHLNSQADTNDKIFFIVILQVWLIVGYEILYISSILINFLCPLCLLNNSIYKFIFMFPKIFSKTMINTVTDGLYCSVDTTLQWVCSMVKMLLSVNYCSLSNAFSARMIQFQKHTIGWVTLAVMEYNHHHHSKLLIELQGSNVHFTLLLQTLSQREWQLRLMHRSMG